jgi:hypothetical protein
MENEESGILGTDSDTVSRENAATSTTGVGEPHDVPDEGDEVRVYVFAGQGRRGVDSLVSRRPRLERLRADEKVVEVRRRRYRTAPGGMCSNSKCGGCPLVTHRCRRRRCG